MTAPPFDGVAWLKRTTVFAGVDDDDLRLLARSGVVRSLGRGVTLWRKGDTPDAVAVVVGGELRVVKNRGRVLRVLAPPEMVGLSTLAGTAHSADVVAGEGCRVFVLGGAPLRRLVAKHPGMALAMVAALAAKLGELSDDLVAVNESSLQQRTLARVLRLGRGLRQVKVTHAELAAQLGATRSNVSRALERLQDSGRVRLARGCIEIL